MAIQTPTPDLTFGDGPVRDGPKPLGPGARVLIRDEQWIVRSTKAASAGGRAVHVTGVSELVRGKKAIFLDGLDPVRELRPEDTELVSDPSPHYRRSRLYLETLLRRTPPTDERLHIGHMGAMRPADYQLQPAARALSQPRPRLLIADGVGLGKTVEVGVLLSELIRRGRGERILVVALKSILAQFQEELWARFTIPLVRLDSVGIQRVQSRIPSSMNPFYFHDRVIISIDTLKRDDKYRRWLEQSHWDVVVVDECQHVAVRTRTSASQKSQRSRLAQLLGRTADALILTSATPHDGRPESFASLMNLLEPTAVADEQNYTDEDVAELFIRRFKKDVAHEVQESFQERDLKLSHIAASPAEEAVLQLLRTVEFRTIARTRGGKGFLFRTLLLKAFLSSPAACAASIRNRLDKDALKGDGDDATFDRDTLNELLALVEAVDDEHFRKYGRLLELLRSWDFDNKRSKERVVIFAERIDTLDYLAERLRADLSLADDQLALFHGTLDDTDQTALVKSFGTEASPLRILLGSDAASEGINLHFYCHRLIHFDLPWSLITLEQRNGRIDRFGQKHRPELHYLLTVPTDEVLKGDLRVLDRLIEKEAYAAKNLGDVAWLMNLHEAEAEEEAVARGIEDGIAPEDVVPDQPRQLDFMQILYGDGQEPPPQRAEPVRLYADDLAWACDAFATVLGDDAGVEWQPHLGGFLLRPPDDLKRRFDYLPAELRATVAELKLTTDRERVMDALEASRQDESRWPEWQLFWDLHPVAEWLGDQVLAAFGRHAAPALEVPELDRDERVVLLQGILSNHRSQPTVVDWFGVVFRSGKVREVRPLTELAAELHLDRPLSNPGRQLDKFKAAELQLLLTPAVERAQEHMRELRLLRASTLQKPLKQGLDKVVRWHAGVCALIAAERQAAVASGRTLSKPRAARLDADQREADKLVADRKAWLSDSMRTVEQPYLRVAAVLLPPGGN